LKKLLAELKSDHESLLSLIRDTSPEGGDFRIRRSTFGRIPSAWKEINKAKEQSLYPAAFRKKNLKHLAQESKIEAELIGYLFRKIRASNSGEEWKARTKVLGELIIRHLATEEELLIPLVESTLNSTDRHDILRKYRSLRPAKKKNAGEGMTGKILRLPLSPLNRPIQEGVSP
jgi:hypothetical protein